MKCVTCLAWVLISLYSLVAGLFLYISRSHESPVYWTLDNLVEWYVHEGDKNSAEKRGSFAPLDPPLDPPLFWSPELGIGGESKYSRLEMSLLKQTTKLPAYEPLSTEWRKHLASKLGHGSVIESGWSSINRLPCCLFSRPPCMH